MWTSSMDEGDRVLAARSSRARGLVQNGHAWQDCGGASRVEEPDGKIQGEEGSGTEGMGPEMK